MQNSNMVQLLWKEYTGAMLGERWISPGYLHGYICLPTETGTVLGINGRNGKVEWRFRLPDFQKTNFILSTEKNFVFSTFDERTAVPSKSKSKLYNINYLDGSVEWSYEFSVHSVSAPAIDDENIYLFGADHFLYGFNRNLHQLVQKVITHEAQWTLYPPAAANGYIIVPGGPGFARNGHSLAFQKERLTWDFPIGSHYSPCITGQTVCLISGLHTLHFIDLETGIDKGCVDADKAFTNQLTCAEDLIFVGVRERNQSHAIYCYQSLTKELVWCYPTSGSITLPSIPDGKRLISLDKKSNLYIQNLETGELLSKYDVGAKIISVPIVHDKRIFLVDTQGNLYSLLLA